jgi:hypothetical protein
VTLSVLVQVLSVLKSVDIVEVGLVTKRSAP